MKKGDLDLDTDGLAFAGDYLGGPFIEGAFTSGMNAAKKLEEQIGITLQGVQARNVELIKQRKIKPATDEDISNARANFYKNKQRVF